MKTLLFKKKVLVLLFFSFCFSYAARLDRPVDTSSLENQEDSVITLMFCGDVMGHQPQIKAAYRPESDDYDYRICFEQVRPYIEAADVAVANLEVPLAGKPYSGYPMFSSPDALLDALQYAGFDVILTANNHVADRAKKGLERTIQQIDRRRLLRAGSYVNRQDRDSLYPLMIEKKAFKIALLNCTYGSNGMPVTAPNLVNFIDTLQIREDVAEARRREADFIVMCIHWGEEYRLSANSTQRRLANFLARQGVGLIVGAHPHVVQNREVLSGKDSLQVPVYYSLGNFISNQRWKHSNGGILLRADIHVPSAKILKTAYLPVYVHKGRFRGRYQYHLLPTTDYLRNPSFYALSEPDSTELVFFDHSIRERLGEEGLMTEPPKLPEKLPER